MEKWRALDPGSVSKAALGLFMENERALADKKH
jgi:hypothetical protein